MYNRGVDKRVTFYSQEDYDRFKAYLFLLNDQDATRASNYFFGKRKDEIYTTARGEPLVAIGAYCIMANHFHILATPTVDGGISKFMQRLQTAYTMYFNEKNERTGSLFQGTFKAKHVDSYEYLKYLFAYIHLNPTRYFSPTWKEFHEQEFRRHAAKIMDYPYSSVGEYTQKKFIITTPEYFPKYFLTARDIDAHLKFWLRHKLQFSK